jgi:5-formaminoimidazole-4-carboxamide-1-(beta)-D-ribofuranosyl 5'-monophosphate synthetase
MISLKEITETLSTYDSSKISIGTLGSHSVLDICRGAKDEGFKTIVICEKGREKTYSKYFKTRNTFKHKKGIVDQVILLDKFSEILEKKHQEELKKYNTIFIPHRSFSVYVPYDLIENDFHIPIFGSRNLLRAEERDVERNQYYLLEKAKIRTPIRYENYEDIDRLVIIKCYEKERSYERAFFYASTPNDFEQTSKQMLEKGMISKNGLEKAVIEEFAIGAQFNFNYFYSPLHEEIELLGTDTRRQTNLEGLLKLPANEQLKLLEYVRTKNIEIGHIACTIRESMLDQIYEIGEKFVRITKEEYYPGIIGPFALQGAILPGPPKEEIVIFDASLRVPGSPGTKFTPYTECLWGSSVSTGRRIAMEINEATKNNKLRDIVT